MNRLTAADWRRFLREQGFVGSGLAGIIGALVVTVTIVGIATGLVLWIVPENAPVILGIGIPAASVWLIAILGVWIVSMSRGARMQRWAATRGLQYEERYSGSGRIPFRGMPFPGGGKYTLRRLLLGTDLTSARFQALPDPNGTNTFLKPFSFVTIGLPASVPHIVVTNKRSSVLSWAGLAVARGVKLGGSTEFDEVFTLHCPADYQRDALYIFTPDLLAALLDYAPGCELELIDDTAFLYFTTEPKLWRPDVADALLVVTDMLRTKLARQTLRYRDDRAPALSQSVSLGGLRLSAKQSGRAKLVILVAWIPFTVAAGWFLATEVMR